MTHFKNKRRLDWDELRIVLAVARAGSLPAAAKLLRVSHPTVFRQSKDLETKLGAQLFERDRDGYRLTAAGREALAVAERVELEIERLELSVSGKDAKLEGQIRIATVDTLMSGPLPAVLRSFVGRMPGVTLDVLTSVSMANLLKREADVAIRAGGTPPDQLVGRRLCRIAVAIYQASDAPPVSESLVRDQHWLSPGAALEHLASAQWIRSMGLQSRVRLRADSLLTLADAAAAGLGVAILPCYLAEPDARLRRIGGPLDELGGELWFLTHPELRKVARIAALSRHLGAEIDRLRDLFEGKCSLDTGTRCIAERPIGPRTDPKPRSRRGSPSP
jgi:DNA-binding transcriptional LysR family regulator